jgi:hypothetical protein
MLMLKPSQAGVESACTPKLKLSDLLDPNRLYHNDVAMTPRPRGAVQRR